MTATIVVVAFAVMLILGTPIAFVLGLAGVIALIGSSGTSLLMLVPQQIFSGMNSFVLMAIPFFILAGELMNASGITKKIVNLSNALVGRMKGGLGHVNIVANVIFATMSGAAVAAVAGLGTILIPSMEESGYDKSYACALTASASVIGPTIPPSIPMVVCASTAGISVAAMFAGGIFPGLLLAVLMMVLNGIISSRRGYQLHGQTYKGTIGDVIKDGIIALGMPAIIFVGILGGVFTATEAAAVAVAYAVIIGRFVFKTLNAKVLWQVFKNAVSKTGVSLLLVSMGGIISWVMASEQVPAKMANIILSVGGSHIVFLLLSIILLLAIGCFMDLTASLIMLTPILLPIAVQLGIDPVHYALIMVVALNIGLITPPVGAVLFVTCAVAREKFENIVREIWPFFACHVIALAIIAFIPALALAIPRALGLL
ncbi:MAG TPA: C4-dicarboxylate ABC transporter permease [Firmicutes bacterium]|nr:C4-dicarboxylate ABC transporter permease [Bacillota bacterium]